MKSLWYTVIYEPIYNALITLAHVFNGNVGLAVIVLTVLIRLLLLPISKKSIIGQYKMRALQPQIDAIKAQKLPAQEESKELFALYATKKINPFSGCLYLLIQLPILFALYFSFRELNQSEHLYSFVSIDNLHTIFLGIIDITKPYLPLAILAGITQGIQAFLTPVQQSADTGFQGQLVKSLSIQTRFVLPIIIIFIASKLVSVVALYWVVTNIFSIFQEMYFRKKYATN